MNKASTILRSGDNQAGDENKKENLKFSFDLPDILLPRHTPVLIILSPFTLDLGGNHFTSHSALSYVEWSQPPILGPCSEDSRPSCMGECLASSGHPVGTQ